jgi:hypothetical protein
MNIKENGPRLEELVGRLARSAQNDVFDFQEEEEDDKPLFAEFFKVKEELAKKAAANKHDKPEGKKSLENRLSSEEKSDNFCLAYNKISVYFSFRTYAILNRARQTRFTVFII